MSDALVSMGEKIRNIRAQLTSQGAPFEVQQVTLSDGRSVAAYRNALRIWRR